LNTAPQFPSDYRRPGRPQETPHRPRQRRTWWIKLLGWAAGVVTSLIVLIILAAAVALHSKTLHRYVLRVAQEKASAAMSTSVSLRDFALHFSGISPALDLYDLAIAGAPPSPAPPLAQAEHLHVAVTVTSLLHSKWYVEDIDLVRPVIHLQVDSQGKSNLPQMKSSGSQGNTNIFDLGVRHATIEDGEIYYNDRKMVVSADLHQLDFLSTYGAGRRSYSGRLGYRNGHLLMQNVAPLPHQLDAEFVATPDAFVLRRAILRSGNSSLELTANMHDYSNPKIDARYNATLDAGEFGRELRQPSLPTGVIRAAGIVNYTAESNRPFLELVKVSGNLRCSQLLVRASSFRQAITGIFATYRVANGNLLVPRLRAGLLGGELTAHLTTRDLAGNSHSHLTATLRAISLRSVQSLAGNTESIRQLGISGAVNGTADATWGKTLDNLIARANAGIQARVAGSGTANPVPVHGSLRARYDASHKQVDVANSYLRTPQTSLTMGGSVSNRSALQVNLQANDLHELEALAAIIRPGQPPFGLHGRATLHATVTGSTDAPRIESQLTAIDLRVRGTAWRLLRANANLNPSQIALAGGELDPAQRGRMRFAMSAALNHWAFADNSPVEVSFDASQIDIGEITRGAGIQTPISGILAAAVSMHGSEQNPVGNGRISLTKAKIQDEPVNSVTLELNGAGETLVANLKLAIPAGSANADLTLRPKQKAYEMRLQANGIQLEKLATLKQRNIPLIGILNLGADGKGTFDNPGLNATVEIPQLDIRGQRISGIRLQTSLVDHVGTFNLRSDLVNTSVNAHGSVRLTGDYPAEAALDTQPIPFEPLLAIYAPSQAGNIRGQTELHARIRGPLKRKDLLEAHVTIPQLGVNYKNIVQIAAAGPIRADYVKGVLEVPRGGIRGTGTDLQFQGRVPLTTDAPASMLLQGSVDLRLAQLFDPDILSSGQLKFDINSFGKSANPDVHGEVHIVNANFATGTVPLGLEDGNGVLTLLQDRLQITKFHGTVGGGEFSASGTVVYRPALRFDVALAGQDTRVLYNNVRGAFNTKLALVGSMDKAQLQGQVNVEQLQFTPAFDLMDFMGELGGGASTPPPVGGFEQALGFNVAINSTAGVNLVSRTMSLQAAANLRLTGTAAQPVILGRIDLSGGDLIFNGNRYVLQGGTVDFVNPSETEPVVNVSVSTEVQQYNVQMHFWGPVDHLQTNYSSDPALPPSDIIHLIAFGKTQEASAANPNPPGNLAAEEAVASQVSGQVTNRVEKVAGLSQLSVDPLLGTNQGESPGARLTVQQRVTGKIFVTFSTDTTSTQNTVIKMEFQQTPRVSYSGTRDQNGGFGFDRRIRKEW
jgi:translocation and assembly module TamB